MKRIQTILQPAELKFLRDEKRSIIKGFRRVRRDDNFASIPQDGYKSWLTWRLIALIEKIDVRSCQDINVLLAWKKSK
jgi:hypothetical protein